MFKKFVGLATLLVAMAFASSVAMGTDAAKPAGFCVNVSFELDDSAGVFTYEKIPWKLLKAVPDPKYLEEKGVPPADAIVKKSGLTADELRLVAKCSTKVPQKGEDGNVIIMKFPYLNNLRPGWKRYIWVEVEACTPKGRYYFNASFPLRGSDATVKIGPDYRTGSCK